MPEYKFSPDDIIVRLNEIEERLVNPKQAMEAIGFVLIAAAQEAFETKEFGTFKWPQQYESQPSPWIHKAGAASDLAKGERIKSSRFGAADTLRDSNELSNSFATRVVSRSEVQVGSNKRYAKFHQWGSDLVGPSVQAVTSTMRSRLQREYDQADGSNKQALGKMFGLFKKDSIRTHVRQRPFLGITDQIEEDIRGTIELFVDTGQI